MQKPLRILLVSHFEQWRHGAAFYCQAYRIANALTRLGHFVFPFSDRDEARSRNPLNKVKLGFWQANRALIKTAEMIEPDLILLVHSTIVWDSTLAKIRQRQPNVRIGVMTTDASFNEKSMEKLMKQSHQAEHAFITSYDPGFRSFGEPGCPVRYVPNSVDPAIDRLECFENLDPDYDCVFLGRGGNRAVFLEQARALLPSDYKLFYPGHEKGHTIWGAKLLDIFARSNVGLNLHRPVPKPPALYSSDRLSLLMGNGQAALVFRPSGLEQLYGDAAVYYDDPEGLVEAMLSLKADPARARSIGKRAKELTQSRFSGDKVCRFMLECIYEGGPGQSYAWPTDPILAVDSSAPKALGGTAA